jgi:hypothetical protein
VGNTTARPQLEELARARRCPVVIAGLEGSARTGTPRPNIRLASGWPTHCGKKRQSARVKGSLESRTLIAPNSLQSTCSGGITGLERHCSAQPRDGPGPRVGVART